MVDISNISLVDTTQDFGGQLVTSQDTDSVNALLENIAQQSNFDGVDLTWATNTPVNTDIPLVYANDQPIGTTVVYGMDRFTQILVWAIIVIMVAVVIMGMMSMLSSRS